MAMLAAMKRSVPTTAPAMMPAGIVRFGVTGTIIDEVAGGDVLEVVLVFVGIVLAMGALERL